jgi:hypothetical protein
MQFCLKMPFLLPTMVQREKTVAQPSSPGPPILSPTEIEPFEEIEMQRRQNNRLGQNNNHGVTREVNRGRGNWANYYRDLDQQQPLRYTNKKTLLIAFFEAMRHLWTDVCECGICGFILRF